MFLINYIKIKEFKSFELSTGALSDSCGKELSGGAKSTLS